MGYALHGATYDTILTHYYKGTALGIDRPRPARSACCCSRSSSAHLQRRGQGRLAQAEPGRHVPRCPATASRRSALYRGSKRVAIFSAPLQVAGKDGVLTLSGHGRLPRRAGVPPEHVRAEHDQRGAARAVRARRGGARVAVVVAARGAEGTGRRRAHVRDHDLQGRRRTSTSTPTRARRSTAASRPRSISTNAAVAATHGQVVTYNGAPVVTYFFSTSGGRTENVENTFTGSEPKPWLQSVNDPYDGVSPKHRWGPIRMSTASAARQAQRAGQGALQGHPREPPRQVAADRHGDRDRHRRPHARERRDAARALRAVRHVGVLHVDQHQEEEAAGVDAQAPTARPAAPRTPPRSRRPQHPSAAASTRSGVGGRDRRSRSASARRLARTVASTGVLRHGALPRGRGHARHLPRDLLAATPGRPSASG